MGSGPAGLAFAVTAASRGHQVTLFEAEDKIGGQLNIAVQVPGKEEFHETLRYFRVQLQLHRVDIKLQTAADSAELSRGNYDTVAIACGVHPRIPQIEGIEHPSVLTYLDVLKTHKTVGQRVAVVGAGGIGFDVAEYLSHKDVTHQDSVEDFIAKWNIDPSLQTASRNSAIFTARFKRIC